MIERVDPELRAVLAALPDLGGLSVERLPQVRDVLQGGALEPVPGVPFERVRLPGLGEGDPDVPAILYRPDGLAAPAPALLNIHGGGYVAGDAAREHRAMGALAAALGCVILAVDYRLAPECPYPAALDDCDAALAWLHDQAGGLGIDPARIGVRGVSAGGGLAAGLALRRTRARGPQIRLLALLYPMLDDRTPASPVCGQHVWTADANAFGWRSYLGKAAASPPDEAVPARAADLAAYPPTFIAVGAIDLFAGECLDFAARLLAHGVATELHLYPGAYHGFNLVGGARVAAAYERDQRDALARAFEEETQR